MPKCGSAAQGFRTVISQISARLQHLQMLTAATKKELKRRRREAATAVGTDGVLIIPAATEVVRNREVHYPFRQNCDFS